MGSSNPESLAGPDWFSGTVLYGNDFDRDAIEAWYADEREGYAYLRTRDPDRYGYHALNTHHLFGHLPDGPLGDVLGLGAGPGREFEPIVGRARSITILEASSTLRSPSIGGVPIVYADVDPSGVMPFDDGNFDLVTSLGVLHHIPNVSFVADEIARVTRPGGYALVREPVVSMGDWRRPRPGLTARERGIPPDLLIEMFTDCFEVVRRSWCSFPLPARLRDMNAPAAVRFDAVASRSFAWNHRYHATTRWQKVRPRSLALVLRRVTPGVRHPA